MTSFATLAKLIGDPTIASKLENAARAVKTEIHNAKYAAQYPYPTVSDTRDRVKQVQRDARRFKVALRRVSDPERPSLNLPWHMLEAVIAAGDATEKVLVRCGKVLARYDNDGRPRIPGKVACACIVVDAWSEVRGSVPGHNNQDLARACELLWHLCGGESINGADWSNAIRNAKRRSAEAKEKAIWKWAPREFVPEPPQDPDQ